MQYKSCRVEPVQITGRLLTIRIKNGTLLLKADCPIESKSWRGFAIAYKHKIEADREAYLIPADQVEKKGNRIVLSSKLDLKSFPFRRTHWAIYAIYDEQEQLFGAPLKAQQTGHIKKVVRFLQNNSYVSGDNNILFPYYTKGQIVSLRYREQGRYDGFGTRLKECIATIYYRLFKSSLKQKGIFLVHEKRCNKAQDNGYYFFKYCMENNAEQFLKRHIYYVIETDAADYHKISKYKKNVLRFMSVKHMAYLLACRLIISSDSRSHAFAWQNKNSLIAPYVKKKKHVFLQHGILALKRLNTSFLAKNMNSSMVTVSSELEGKIVEDYLGYDKEKVAITGYARFDALEDKSDNCREILLMPTFRNWLFGVESDVFKKSDYYERYMAILNSSQLHATLEKYNIVLNFYLHPSIAEHIGSFTSSSKKVHFVPYGQEPLDELMMRCKMLITDYSSVTWDVYYLGKPVLFYQYDVDIYQETWGSYIDLETELPGDRAIDLQGLLDLIDEYAENEFRMKSKYEMRKASYYRYIDRNNCERICNEIKIRQW